MTYYAVFMADPFGSGWFVVHESGTVCSGPYDTEEEADEVIRCSS